MRNIILASASGIRLKILNDFGFNVKVEVAHVDEDEIKNSLLAEKFSSFDISRALAETKAKKISSKIYNQDVLGADQVLDLEGNIFNKPENMELASSLMKRLNGKEHSLFSSICLSKNGSTIWMHTEQVVLKMKRLTDSFIKDYLAKVGLETIKKYGVYQIEGTGKDLFVSKLIEKTLEKLVEDVLFIRAVRGLQNEEGGLYPEPVLAAVLPKYPKLKMHTIADTNHYDILLDEVGAEAVAQLIYGAK